MKLRAIFFDLDGTLADNFSVVMQAYRETFSRYVGKEFSDADIVAMFGPDVEGIIQREVPDRWTSAVETFYSLFDSAYAAHDATVHGVAEALAILDEQHIHQAVVTGSSVRGAEITLRHVGLADNFPRVYAGSAQGNRKAESLREAVFALGLRRSEAAYIGDSPHDIAAARESGLVPLGAAWCGSSVHFHDQMRQSGPVALFQDTQEFIQWIRRHLVHGSS